jgi:hypothetical protein
MSPNSYAAMRLFLIFTTFRSCPEAEAKLTMKRREHICTPGACQEVSTALHCHDSLPLRRTVKSRYSAVAAIVLGAKSRGFNISEDGFAGYPLKERPLALDIVSSRLVGVLEQMRVEVEGIHVGLRVVRAGRF